MGDYFSMKKIILFLFILNTFQLYAEENIKNFQIEGLNIEESALDYFSESEIKASTQNFKYKNNDFIPVGISKNLKIYDNIQFYYKNVPSKPIHVISGIIYFENNIEACLKKKEEVILDLKKVFKNVKEEDLGVIKNEYDKSGKSTKTNYRFNFKNGDYILVACYDWSKKTKFKDHLRVAIVKKDFDHWIYNVANK